MKENLKELYKESIKSGKYELGKSILTILRDKKVELVGYYDSVFEVENELSSILRPCYSHDCSKVTFYLSEKFLVKGA